MALVCKEFQIDDTLIYKCWGVVKENEEVFIKLKELTKLLNYSNKQIAYALIDDDLKFTWKELEKLVIPVDLPEEYINCPSFKRLDPIYNEKFVPWGPEAVFTNMRGIAMLMNKTTGPEKDRFSRHRMPYELSLLGIEVLMYKCYVMGMIMDSQEEDLNIGIKIKRLGKFFNEEFVLDSLSHRRIERAFAYFDSCKLKK